MQGIFYIVLYIFRFGHAYHMAGNLLTVFQRDMAADLLESGNAVWRTTDRSYSQPEERHDIKKV